MFKKILVPLDGSELAETVLPNVCEIAKCFNSEIVLLRIAVVPQMSYDMAGPTMTAFDQNQIEANVSSYLSGVASGLKNEGLNVTTEVAEGAVADTITDFAQSVHADLIAMSTHGRGGLVRFVIGSVADQVVRGAHIPVLLIRPVRSGS